MNISTKVVFATVLVFAVTIMFVYVLSQTLVYDAFYEMNAQHMLGDLTVINNLISMNVGYLDSLAADYARWDDTYDFVETGSMNYIESNFVDETLIENGLRAVIIADANGKIIYSKGMDLESETESEVPPQLISDVRSGRLSACNNGEKEHMAGLFRAGDEMLIVGTAPITKSDGSGPCSGTFIFARPFSDSFLENLLLEDHHYSLSALEDAFEPAHPENVLIERENIYVSRLGFELMRGELVLEDVYGSPILLVSIEKPSYDYVFAGTGTVYFLLLIVVVGILSVIVLHWFMENEILNPLEGMMKGVAEIGRTGDLSKRIPEVSGELGQLAKHINESFGSIQALQEKLYEIELKHGRIVERSADSIIILSIDGIILYANSATSRLSGYKIDEIIGRSIFDFLSDESRLLSLDNFRKKLSGIEVAEPYDVTVVRKDGGVRRVEISSHLDVFKGGREVFVMAHDVTNRRLAEREIRHRLELERLISSVSSRMVSHSEIDKNIGSSLADMGRAAGADRAYLFLMDEGGNSMSNTHEWCALGVEPQKQNLQNLSVEMFPWWAGELSAGRVLHVTDVSKMPSEAKAEKEILEMQGVKSVLVVPVLLDGKLSGFVGFDNISEIGGWSEEDKTILHIFSEILSNAISARRSFETVKAGEERYRHLVESLQEGIWKLDTECNTVFVNNAMLTMLGLSSGEMIGRNITEFINLSPDEINACKGELMQMREGGRLTKELALKKKDGSAIYAVLNISPIFKGGEYSGALVGVIDITERREAELKIIEKTEELDKFFSASLDLLCVVDTEGRFVRLNPEWEKVLGYRLDELEGKKFIEFVHPDDVKPTNGAMSSLLKEKEQPYFMNRYRKKDGGYRWIEWRSYVVGNKIYAAARDVTERRKTEEIIREYNLRLEAEVRARTSELLEEKEKVEILSSAKDEFIRNITHELKTPLSVILGNLPVLRDEIRGLKAEKGDRYAAVIDMLERNAERLSSSIEQILELSRLSEHKLRKEKVDIHKLAKDVRDEYTALAKMKGLRLTLKSSPLTINANPSQVKLVLSNLVSNALKFTQKGSVAVEVSKSNGFAKITVSDTGIGISRENIKRLFTKFFKAEPTAPGTGIGLAITKSIVEAHGGSIKAESEVGKGTVFTVMLPIDDAGPSGAGISYEGMRQAIEGEKGGRNAEDPKRKKAGKGR